MSTDHRDELKNIRTFPSLVRYLRDEMDWPIQQESFEDVDDLFYDFTPEELGLDTGTAAKIESIKRLRPLSTGQPWGIYFVKFEPKRLPVVALRRILSRVALKKRASANKPDMPSWHANDLLFVSNYGDQEQRCITFAHFTQHDEKDDLPTLKVLGWDNSDTPLHLDDVADKLRSKLRWPDDPENLTMWRDSWRSAFTLEHREVITTSKALAVRLAGLARAIRDRIRTVLAIEAENGPVTKLMKAFQEALVHDLDENGFADMYAQTIAYGLLSARITNPKANTADGFAAQLPVTNPFLKELMETFLHVGGRNGNVARGRGIDFDELGVSEVVELLDNANMEAVVRDFGDKNPQEDPVIHFYELFLKEYDKKQKVSRGVFYTPRPVVSYIVRSVHELLQTEFGLADGLADTTTWDEMARRHKDLVIPEGVSPDHTFVQILDPATGTGTFLVEVIDLILKTLMSKWMALGYGEKKIETLWNEYVPKHLLPRLHGYELLMAPYAIAHLKIGLKLYETGYRFESDERARIYLTNALEPAHDFSGKFEFMIPALAHEAQAVNEIKRNKRFTVVIGNPPYARISSNMGSWISGLIEDFKYVDGVHFGEVKHWLHDDYVKYIRLAYHALAKTSSGVLGMITNRGYISGPTFRGMRAFIWQNSSTLHILDLHGGAIQEECKPPIGVSDENVFEIKQGVSIFISVLPSRGTSQTTRTYAELWGDRKVKYDLLAKRSALSDPGTDLAAVSPRYDFIPQSSMDLDREYSDFISVNDIFPIGSTGIQTSRDNYVIDFEKSTLQDRFEEFCNSNLSDSYFRTHYGLDDGRNWSLSDARAKLRVVRDWNEKIVRCQFRPLDIRWMLYHSSVINWPRPEVMPHMLRHNIAIVVPRNYQGDQFDAALVSRFITEVKAGESTRGSYCYPLYIYAEEGLLSMQDTERTPNIDSDFITALIKHLKLFFVPHECGDLKSSFGPEDVLNYVYACLYSHGYRERYSNLIKNGFPRLPLPGTVGLFRDVANLGCHLVAFHLMESTKLDRFITTYTGQKNPKIVRVGWSNDIVWLDVAATRKDQSANPGTIGFFGVSEPVWNFRIGGYKVCEKWLKDRRGRALSSEDIVHYQKIVVAISETISLMHEIDEVIDSHGGWPKAFAGGSTAEREPECLTKIAEHQAEYNALKDKKIL